MTNFRSILGNLPVYKISHFGLKMPNFRPFLTNFGLILKTQIFVQAGLPARMGMVVSLKYAQGLLFLISGPQN